MCKRNMRRLVSASMSLMMLLAFCPMSTTFADKPDIVFIPVDDTFTDTGLCPFTVVGTVEGTIKITRDPASPNVLESSAVHFHETLANPATGKSVKFPASEKMKIQLVEDDNSVLVVFTGLSIQVTVPGEGRIFTQTGRGVFAPPCPDIFQCGLGDLVFVAGHHDEDFTPICNYLADP